jgi:purine-binding chemotaxis protein CheW
MNAISSEPLELLTFRIAERGFGLPTAITREIIRAVLPTPLPRTAPFIEGVINVRGEVMPLIDMRRRLGLPHKPIEHTDHLVICRRTASPLALRVDRVLGLWRIARGEIAELPPLPHAPGSCRVAAVEGELVPILEDVDALLTADATIVLEAALPEHRASIEKRTS